MVMVASLPITWAAIMVTDSGTTGLTLPGMMLEPGCKAGNAISPSPASGPLFIQRRSFAIFHQAHRHDLELAGQLHRGVLARQRLEVVVAGHELELRLGGQMTGEHRTEILAR